MRRGYDSDEASESNMLKRRRSATGSITSSLSETSNIASPAVVIDNSTYFMEKYRQKQKIAEVAALNPLLPEATNISASEVRRPNAALGVLLARSTLQREVEAGVLKSIEETLQEFMESAPGLGTALDVLYNDHESLSRLGSTERRHWLNLNAGSWTENEEAAYSFGSSLGSVESSGRLQFVLLHEILRLRRTTEQLFYGIHSARDSSFETDQKKLHDSVQGKTTKAIPFVDSAVYQTIVRYAEKFVLANLCLISTLWSPQEIIENLTEQFWFLPGRPDEEKVI